MIEKELDVMSVAPSLPDLNKQLIETVVYEFYAGIRQDALLGPIFNQAIDDWEPHLQTMVRFWSAVMLHDRSYDGRPMPKHIPLPIDARHFDHWLELFGATVTRLCSAQVADLFLTRATTIARSLEMGVAFHNGASIKLGERYLPIVSAHENPARVECGKDER